MAIAACLNVDPPPPTPQLEIPQLGIFKVARDSLYDLPDLSKYILKLQDATALALAPIRRFLDVIAVLIAIKRCISAVPDSLLPPNPSAILECIEDLTKEIEKKLGLLRKKKTSLSLNVIEVKRAKSTLATCSQLERYCGYFVDIMKGVKDYIASPEISDNALKYTEKNFQTYLKVNHNETTP